MASLLTKWMPKLSLRSSRTSIRTLRFSFCAGSTRHILGIEILESFPDTVSRSIDQFIAEHPTLTSHQLQFLNLLRDYLIHRGGIEKRDLIQAPFTIIHPSGIRGVFSPAEINEILALTERLAA
jgi:type I restriction enzyme, R subunit